MPGFGFAVASYFGGQAIGFGPILMLLVTVGAIAGGLGLLLFTVGVAVYVFAPVRAPGCAEKEYASYRTILGSLYLAVVAANVVSGLYYVGQRLSGTTIARGGATTLAGRALTPDSLIVAALTQELAILAILYLRVVRPKVITWEAMGLNGRHLPWRLVQGLLSALGVVAVMGAISYLLGLLGVQQTQEQLFEPIRQGTLLQFAVLLTVVSALTGVVEESFFRGYVFGGLYREKGPRQAYLASATIFAAAHLDLRAFLPLLAAGLLLAYVYHRTQNIIPSIVAHAINNGLGLAIIYFSMA